jgi:hypothetical protein
MNMKELLSDLKGVLFAPKVFIEQRFLKLTSKRIFVMSGICVFLGLLLGSLLTLLFSHYVLKDYSLQAEAYQKAIKSLGLDDKNFLELLKAQRAYSLLLAILSPVIAYIAPHLFGGALFIFLRLFTGAQNKTLNFFRVMECSAIALTSFAYYVIPAVGPIITLVLLAVTTSRALAIEYRLVGFMKIIAILSAIYFCAILTSTTLQLLSAPIAGLLK